MKRKDLEKMAEQAAVVFAWCVKRLPVDTWVGWVVLLVDLIGAQDDATNDIEDVLIKLHARIEIRLCRGVW